MTEITELAIILTGLGCLVWGAVVGYFWGKSARDNDLTRELERSRDMLRRYSSYRPNDVWAGIQHDWQRIGEDWERVGDALRTVIRQAPTPEEAEEMTLEEFSEELSRRMEEYRAAERKKRAAKRKRNAD